LRYGTQKVFEKIFLTHLKNIFAMTLGSFYTFAKFWLRSAPSPPNAVIFSHKFSFTEMFPQGSCIANFSAKSLLDQEGIDVNLRDNKGRTALSIAAHPNLLASANLLLKREDVEWDLPNNDGRTPLFIACAAGNLPVVDLLLKKKGINPNAKDNWGYTPLATVCDFDWLNGRIIEEVVRLLLSHPDTDPCAVDNNGASILDKSSGNKSLPDDTRNTILGLLQAHPRYQQR